MLLSNENCHTALFQAANHNIFDTHCSSAWITLLCCMQSLRTLHKNMCSREHNVTQYSLLKQNISEVWVKRQQDIEHDYIQCRWNRSKWIRAVHSKRSSAYSDSVCVWPHCSISVKLAVYLRATAKDSLLCQTRGGTRAIPSLCPIGRGSILK